MVLCKWKQWNSGINIKWNLGEFPQKKMFNFKFGGICCRFLLVDTVDGLLILQTTEQIYKKLP